jgi:glycosyltransferase involved in cell wall biosynthesis
VVFTVSDFSRDSIRKFYGDGKVVNVVSLTLQQRAISFKSAWTADEWKKKNGLRSYLLYISRFEERKNHYALLKVFYERKLYEEYDLVLVGRRSEECRKFDDLYATLPGEVRKHVVLKTKGVQLEELLEFLVHAKLFVYPSLAEGFGVPPLEAAALAVPVVCSNTTAMKDFGFFGDGHVDCSNEDILFRAIESKILQPGVDQQQQCGLIRDTVLARYSGKNGAIDFLQAAFPESGVSGIKVKSKSERIQQ